MFEQLGERLGDRTPTSLDLVLAGFALGGLAHPRSRRKPETQAR
jgi:hypothetical protein